MSMPSRSEVVAEAGGVPDTGAARARGPPSAEAAASSGRDPFVEVLGDLAEVLAEAVVTGPGLRVRQDAVCLVEVLEAFLRPGSLLTSGWYLRASLRYACWISSWLAVRETPSTS